MADPYTDLAAAEEDVQAAILAALEARCEDPAQVAMRHRYLSRLSLPEGARGVEFGSGTGHIARDMVDVAGCAEVLGIEPGPMLFARSRELFANVAGLRFQQGDAADTGLPSASQDLVVMHTLLCHVKDPAAILAEAARISKPGATLILFDGDYAATSVEISSGDPLEMVVWRLIEDFVHDKRLMRRAVGLLEAAGFQMVERWSESYIPDDPTYFLSVVDRGADLLVREGTVGVDFGDAIKAEARLRVEQGRFFGFMSYIGLQAERTS